MWNYFATREVTLDKNLNSAPDMRVIVYNQSKGLLKGKD